MTMDARKDDYRAMALLATVFAIAHALFYALGGRFDRTTLIEFIHYMDTELLKHRLIETCFYLHIQPPLMNFLVGLGLKLPEPVGNLVFQGVFLFFGLALCMALFALQRELGITRKRATALSLAFTISPSFLIFEHWLFYTFPCALLLTVAALCLIRARATGRLAYYHGLWWALFALCGVRSLFHLVYFVFILFGMIACSPGHRRRIMLTALIPFLLLFSFYAKNAVLFGKFSVCTFSGKNLWITTVGNLDFATREKLITEGKISPLSRINRWCALTEYPKAYQVVEGFEGIPVLRQTHKANGSVNYNHLGFIRIADIYGRDAQYVLRHYPRYFANAVALSTFRYFQSSTSLAISPSNQAMLSPLITLYDYAAYGRLPVDLAPYSRFIDKAGTPPHIFLLIGFPVVWLYGLWAALAGKRSGMTAAQRITLLFLCFNIGFVAVLGCTMDMLETARYRFMTDPFYVALLGVLLQRILAKRRSLPVAATPAPPEING